MRNMAKKKKIKDMCFCIIPGLIGILIIFFSIVAKFSDNPGLYSNISWVFFWVFLGLVLIAHTIITVINLCKCE
jgi:FtsH-binding integral membrane protein